MGFTAGLYTVPKYNGKILEEEQYRYIDTIISYNSNSWAQEKFKTAEEYALYICGENKSSNFVKPNDEIIKAFASLLHDKDNSIFDEKCIWYSNGSGDIYEWFKQFKTTPNEDSIFLNKEQIASFAQFCWEKILEYFPQSCTINHAFKFLPESEDGDEPDIKLFRCDGIEVDFEDGSSRRFETSSDFECNFGLPKVYYDEWSISGYRIGLEAALQILKEVDFDKEAIIYSGGW